MLMALASCHDLAVVAIPGGVTLPPSDGVDAGAAQTIGARYAYGQMSLEEAAALGCRACASPGGGCQFLGTAATSQVVAEALGLTVPHAALAPSGQPIWTDIARRSARAASTMVKRGVTARHILTPAAIRNAMVVHAAVGGSTNLLLHIPAIAHAAGLPRPVMREWLEVNRRVPRLVDVLPNGPHPTVRFYLAGGVPEVMLHLRRHGLLDVNAMTVTGATLNQMLDWWEGSPRREALRARLRAADGVDPDSVIMSPALASERGLTSTVCFVAGNLAPDGAIIKATAIDSRVVGDDGVYRLTGPARIFPSERAAIAAIKSRGDDRIKAGEVLVLIGRGPMGAGMEEVYQVTSALKYLDVASQVALLTDARFSGVSTGPCIGHIGPEALAGGPIGRLRDGDRVRIIVNRRTLEGSIDIVETGADGRDIPVPERLATRPLHPDVRPDPDLPDATRLWAALQNVSGGAWGGCVYDVDAIVEGLQRP
jgi:putative YjhG/YagF family dehydratase